MFNPNLKRMLTEAALVRLTPIQPAPRSDDPAGGSWARSGEPKRLTRQFVEGFARACQPEQRPTGRQRKELPEVELYKPPLKGAEESGTPLPRGVVLPELFCPFHQMYIIDPSRHICPRETLIPPPQERSHKVESSPVGPEGQYHPNTGDLFVPKPRDDPYKAVEEGKLQDAALAAAQMPIIRLPLKNWRDKLRESVERLCAPFGGKGRKAVASYLGMPVQELDRLCYEPPRSLKTSKHERTCRQLVRDENAGLLELVAVRTKGPLSYKLVRKG